MNDQAIQFYAKKFFPHLIPAHGFAIVKELWGMHNRNNQPK